jgi:hypothetical protein
LFVLSFIGNMEYVVVHPLVRSCSCISDEKFNSYASIISYFIIVYCVYSLCIIVYIYMKTHTSVILFSTIVIFDDSFSMYIVVIVDEWMDGNAQFVVILGR